MKHRKKSLIGNILMISGLALVLAALIFTAKNILTEREAAEAADDTLDELDQYLAALTDPALTVPSGTVATPPVTESSPGVPATSGSTPAEPGTSRQSDVTADPSAPSGVPDTSEPSEETGSTAESAVTGSTAATTKVTATTPPPLTVPSTDPGQVPNYVLHPNMSMPTVELNGVRYLGILEIPTLGLRLPVTADCDMNKLGRAACRYWGSAYLDTMVIAAHNYAKYFGRLKNLVGGDSVFFTDMAGNVFYYRVSGSEVLEPDDVVEMITGAEWDLTLYTCTPGGMERLAVRCVRQGK